MANTKPVSEQANSPAVVIQQPIVEKLGLPVSPAENASLKSWIPLQQQALAYCKQNPLPSSNDELWRYTKLSLFPWQKLQSPTVAPLTLEVFGVADKQVSDAVVLNDTAVIDSLSAQNLLFQGNPGIDNLQIAYANDVTTISITKSIPNDEPLQLSKLVNGNSIGLVFIEVQEGVSCTIIEDLSTASASDDSFIVPQTQFLLKAGSSLTFISLQRLSDKAHYYGRFKFFLERDAQLKSTFMSLGAQVSKTDIECVTVGPGASAEISCLYLIDAKRHVDFHTEQQHVSPHCYSNLQCKGALRDSARGVYYGFIRVAEGAQKSDAYQKAKTMLLSKNARADNIPNLEIKANDVRCSHGASVSPVSGEELFYLQSRGISQQAAEILLLQGFFEDTLQKISNKNIQEYCMTRVMERL